MSKVLTEVANELVRKLPYKNKCDCQKAYYLHKSDSVFSVQFSHFSNMGVSEQEFAKNVETKQYNGIVKE